MFKNFGLKEILHEIKRSALLIIIIVLAFSAMGFLFSTKDSDLIILEPAKATEYSCSRYYLVTDIIDTTSAKSPTNIGATTCSAMVTADYTKEYVFDKLSQVYTNEELVGFLGEDYENQELNYLCLNGIISSNVLNNTSIVNFYAQSKDLDFCESIIKILDEYFHQTILKQTPNINEASYLGGSSVQLNTPSDAVTISPNNSIKYIVLFAFIGFVVSMFYVMLSVLITPRIASKADFECYSVKVIDDQSVHKHNKDKYTKETISGYTNDLDIDSFAVISTIKDTKFLNEISIFSEGAITSANNIISDFTEYEKLKNKSNVIMIERKGITKHKDYEATLNLLKQKNICTIGVILY